MYYHICKKEVCNKCNNMSCFCEQKHDINKNLYSMMCPICGNVMHQNIIKMGQGEIIQWGKAK